MNRLAPLDVQVRVRAVAPDDLPGLISVQVSYSPGPHVVGRLSAAVALDLGNCPDEHAEAYVMAALDHLANRLGVQWP